MKKVLTLFIVVCCTLNVLAFDEEDYRAYAATMREQVWKKTSLPEFDNHRCPPSMKKESAVILASYDEVTIDQRKRLRGNAINLTLYSVRQLTYNHIKRRMVVINDKQALDRFSQFDYQAFKKDHTYGIGDDVSCMALGVRVIKPDGTIKEVSTDEFVQNAEGKKGQVKREKLTVPGLQVGDIIDYFMATMLQVREENIPPLSISYINNYPTLSFRVHIEPLILNHRPTRMAMWSWMQRLTTSPRPSLTCGTTLSDRHRRPSCASPARRSRRSMCRRASRTRGCRPIPTPLSS